jgi:hypothetical protein
VSWAKNPLDTQGHTDVNCAAHFVVRIATASVNVSISRAIASQGPTFCAIVVKGGRILPAMNSWNVETAKICTVRVAVPLHRARDLDAGDHFAVPASARTVCVTNADAHHTLTRNTKCRIRADQEALEIVCYISTCYDKTG